MEWNKPQIQPCYFCSCLVQNSKTQPRFFLETEFKNQTFFLVVNIPLPCPQRKLYTDLVSIIDCLLLEQKNYQTCVVTKKTHGVDLSRAKLSVYRIVGIYKGRQTDRLTSGYSGIFISVLQNSHIFYKCKQQSIFKQNVWSECKNGEEENITVCIAYIEFVQNYLFFQQRKFPSGLILTQPFINC